MQELHNNLLNLEAAYGIFNWHSLVFLVEAIVILWLGKLVNDLLNPYSVDEQLTKVDNKALAISYSGYMVGQGIIVLGVLASPSTGDFVRDLIAVAVWSLVGIILLNLAGAINDKLILRGFSSTKEIIEDKNAGVGAVQAGAFLGTAWLIKAIVAGEAADWTVSALGVAIFFVIGQLAFIIFGLIYAKVAGYDVHAEMERDNIAAGASFGLSLIAVGIILSKTVTYTQSLPAFGVWFVTGMALILISRILVDKMLLPSHHLKEEIAKDQNWGVALVEGGSAVIVALLLNASFGL